MEGVCVRVHAHTRTHTHTHTHTQRAVTNYTTRCEEFQKLKVSVVPQRVVRKQHAL